MTESEAIKADANPMEKTKRREDKPMSKLQFRAAVAFHS